MDEVSRAIHTIKRHQQEGQAIRELLNGGQNVVILRVEDIERLKAEVASLSAISFLCRYCHRPSQHNPDCAGIRIQKALNSALSFKSNDLEIKTSR